LCLRGLSAAECATLNAATPKPSPLFAAAPAAFLPALNAFPLPQAGSVIAGAGANGFGTFAAGYSNPGKINTTGIRVDHTFNNKLTIFSRYQDSPSSSITRSGGNLQQQGTNTLMTWTLTGGATILISPTTTDDLRVNFS